MLRFLIFTLIVAGGTMSDKHEHHDYNNNHNQKPEIPVPDNPHSTHKLNDETHNHQHESPHSVVTPEYLKAFQCFSRNLLKQPNYYEAYENMGAVSYCTFTVAHILANIQEKVFSVRTAGIVKALELPRENITNAYAAILDNFLEDPHVKSSSTLFTSVDGFVPGQNYKKLHTMVDVLKLHDNSEASSYINRQIGINTHHSVVDRLVPHDPPFNVTAVGVFVNTFYYKNAWDVPFTPVGERTFYTLEKEVQLRTLEVMGTFRYFETDDYSAVAIPLEGGRKQVVFVRPKKTMQDYLSTSVEDIFKIDPATWYKRLLRVQVPYLNLVMARNYQAQLNALGGTETGCCGRPDIDEVIDVATRHYIQPVVQVVSLRLSDEGYEQGIATGTQVNKRVHHGDSVTSTTTEQAVTIKSEENEELEITVQSGKYSRQGHDAGVTDFIVNNPFFVYLRDNSLGAVSFTAIRSTFDLISDEVPKARHHAQDISTDFTEEAKVHRWNCHSHN